MTLKDNNMKFEIFRVKLGLNSCYLICGKDIVMGDCGMPKKLKVFKKASFPKFKPDILIGDEPYPHKEYGIEGNIIHTPGHTFGSISIIPDSGKAFVGCMAHNGLPFRLRLGLPIYAQDIEAIKECWKILIDRGIIMIYPGHGKPFPLEVIKKSL